MTDAIEELAAPDSDDAAPSNVKRKRRTKRKSSQPQGKGKGRATENSDPEDEDFTSGGSSDASDSGIEEIITNEEVNDFSSLRHNLNPSLSSWQGLFPGRPSPTTPNGLQLPSINPRGSDRGKRKMHLLRYVYVSEYRW